jgi:alpha-mannosidase
MGSQRVVHAAVRFDAVILGAAAAVGPAAAQPQPGALGRPYPGSEIRGAWIDVLFGQFHDILPGSGVRATREYQSGLFQQSAAAFRDRLGGAGSVDEE